MVKKHVKNIPVGRLVQAFLVLNEGTGGEVADLTKAIFAWITGRPQTFTVAVSIEQAIDFIDKDPLMAVRDAGKMLLITQLIIMLAEFAGLPKKTHILSTKDKIVNVCWW